jgi:hypothetical protein
MTNVESLSSILWAQWQAIRQLTYDYLDTLEPAQLSLRLPFVESKPIGYQFWCMVGAHESYLRKLEYGEWHGFASSLDQFEAPTPAIIKQQMQLADARMAQLLSQIGLHTALKNGQLAHEVVNVWSVTRLPPALTLRSTPSATFHSFLLCTTCQPLRSTPLHVIWSPSGVIIEPLS